MAARRAETHTEFGVNKHAAPNPELARPVLLNQSNRPAQPPDLMKGKENINKAQARNPASDIKILRNHVNPRVMSHEKVLAPEWNPWKKKQGRPHFKTDHYIKDRQPTVHARFLRGGTSGTLFGLRFRPGFPNDPFWPLSGKSAGGGGSFLRRPDNRCSDCRPQ